MRKPSFVSLFSGCGGFDLGFERAGFRCLRAFEIDSNTASVYRNNLAGTLTLCDLSKPVQFSKDLRKVDVVIAGPPCQGFSTIGKRALNDPRNSLLVEAARLAISLRPKVIVLENVAGVLAGSHRRFWNHASQLLRSNAYKTSDIVCDTAELGLSQKRKRILCFAWKGDFDGPIELPKRDGGTLKDALQRLRGLPNHQYKLLDPNSRAGRIARCIKQGQKLCNVRLSPRAVHTWSIPEVFGRTTCDERMVLEALVRRRRQQRVRDFGDADPVSANALRHAIGRPVANVLARLIAKGYVRQIDSTYDLAHTFNGKFRRLGWMAPAPTVDTKFGDANYFLHPEEHRAFSVREAARIQGFPDDFIFAGPLQSQFQMIGNAVPPPVAQLVAALVSRRLLN